ncbi:response regulator [Leptospira sp. GIMC2001]|uniref:response regulator n=1 Tax=Leptospira sp. GIMC2001 TaxID=1513297 RepID=UPI002349FF11|nr:response regulator transcription factor [Leptospira sp. GIMC2001]WCL49678.1 response regulator transcription factor [Leptospira sp. GIMC2001]
MATIKVSIVEDNEKVITNLSELFAQQSEFQLNEIYSDADSAVQNVFKNPPDILILDIGLPGKSGISILEELKLSVPDMKIVMYTVFEDEDNIIQAIKKGANGYLLKDTPLDLLIAELKVIQLGGSPLTPRIATRIIDEFNTKIPSAESDIEESNLLSNREKEVLNLVSLGLVYSDIADELDISPHTVSRHVENIYKKLNVHSKSQAIIRGRRLGIIQDGKYQI